MLLSGMRTPESMLARAGIRPVLTALAALLGRYGSGDDLYIAEKQSINEMDATEVVSNCS